jgi:hypothetical protein
METRRCCFRRILLQFSPDRLVADGALRGGMPLYKFVANKALTASDHDKIRTESP